MVLQPLRPGQHGVVVGHHDDRAGRRRSPYAAAPGRRPGVRWISSSIGRRRRWAAITSRPVLDEAAGVEQVIDVLAGGALAGPAPPGDRVGPGGVKEPTAWRSMTSARSARTDPAGPRRPGREVLVRRRARTPRPGRPRASRCRRRRLDGDRPRPSIRSPRCSIFIDSMMTTGWPARSTAPASTSTATTVPCKGEATTRSTITSV